MPRSWVSGVAKIVTWSGHGRSPKLKVEFGFPSLERIGSCKRGEGIRSAFPLISHISAQHDPHHLLLFNAYFPVQQKSTIIKRQGHLNF